VSESEISGTLTPEQLQELQAICSDLMDDASKVRLEYEQNPTNNSGSLIQVHQNSPYLDESLSDSGWKHVLRSDAPEPNLKIKTAEEALDELFPHRKKGVDNKENKS